MNSDDGEIAASLSLLTITCEQEVIEMILFTVDILITIKREEVVLISRAKEPFMDKLVLSGGHLEEEDESLKGGCAREALEEIGFVVDPEELILLVELDKLGRDPRQGRRISIVYHIDLPDRSRLEDCRAASDAKEIYIKKISELSENDIGFDHYKAIKMIK